MAVKAEVITVGNEILTGRVVNTNAARIGERLLEVGIEPRWTTVVADEPGEIAAAVRHAVKRARVVIVSGGLGPTEDDRTRQGIAQAAGRRLVLREDLLEALRARWGGRGLRMPRINACQAEIPSRAAPLQNPVGSAPGFYLRIRGADVFVVPGVPSEVRGMLEDSILPRLRRRQAGRVEKYRTLRTVGWPESQIAEALGGRLRLSDEWSLAYLPHHLGTVDLRIGAGGSPGSVDRLLGRVAARIRRILGPIVYGEDEENLENIVGALLTKRRRTVAVAESCSGGMIANLLTHVPGSSAYFDRGVVAYSNRAKISILGVNRRILRSKGAVSEEVAVEMARGVRTLSKTHIGLSATGIAGPSGGTSAKPVGLVYIGISAGRRTLAVRHQFPGGRKSVKMRTALAALNMLRLYLLRGRLE